MTSKYSSTSVETTLQNAITSSGATSMVVASGTGTSLMGGVTLGSGNVDIFTVAIDVDTIKEEIVFISNQSSVTMTIVRGRAGTSAVTHSAGASVKHVLTSYDLTNFQGAVTPIVSLGFGGSTSGTTTVQATAVAGTNTLTLPATTSDTLVGKATTDTLTNKTLTTPTINSAKINLAFNAQTGTTYTLVASDSSKLVTASNAAAIVITIPPAIFTAGEQINVQSIGTGLTSFVAGAGVAITSTGGTSAAPVLRAQNSACTIICTASNTFTVIGDLT
jgi:hypothetical protein